MKILVRLPNWLGDMVMAVAFVEQLQLAYPGAAISVIAKDGIHSLLPYFPPLQHQFIFSKTKYKGLRGLWRFGRMIRKTEKFDLFFSLPDSMSAAIMGYATGATVRVGFQKEGRALLLTHTYKRPVGGHRVHEYLALLEQFAKWIPKEVAVKLRHEYVDQDFVVVNINSEAQSRRLTVAKATELLSQLRASISQEIFLIGAPKEQDFVESVYQSISNRWSIRNLAGYTDMQGLISFLAAARVVLTTDSGPAHLANALGTPTIVLFGAGNEANTAPFNVGWNRVIRLNALSCEPCLKNKCVCYDLPQCLERLDSAMIVNEVKSMLV
jgi:lipopolysaccharide heptosyltransferase II